MTMDDKKQEGKKTVVAFVAGLIIGGLLVWLFSGTPKANAPQKTIPGKNADTTLGKNTESTTTKSGDGNGGGEIGINNNAAKEPAQSGTDGNVIVVANQPAGSTVSLGDTVMYPAQEGWIAVQDDINGQLGNVLGAARYDTVVGLKPTMVELGRDTMQGKTYRVVYYSESGDKKFDRKDDVPQKTSDGKMVETTFVAQ